MSYTGKSRRGALEVYDLGIRRLAEIRANFLARRFARCSAYTALCALADHQADQGELQSAIEVYKQLLDKVMASQPDSLNDLWDTTSVSRLYQALVSLYRRTGDSVQAENMAFRQRELWRHWHRKLPKSIFVRRQLEAAGLQ
ncbi:MAG TPA: hypothetical protein VKV15_26785 [Bryobacteraceae bacterium]|nr:hypothetical protein [Bryobacteraceae bacterium]